MLGFIKNITIFGRLPEVPVCALVVAESYRSIKSGFELQLYLSDKSYRYMQYEPKMSDMNGMLGFIGKHHDFQRYD